MHLCFDEISMKKKTIKKYEIWIKNLVKTQVYETKNYMYSSNRIDFDQLKWILIVKVNTYGQFLYYVRVFWGFFEPPTLLRKDVFTT